MDATKYLTVPEAAVAAPVPLDLLRRRVRTHRAALEAAGIMTRIGPLFLVRADRLADLIVAVGLRPTSAAVSVG
jgi:hypothetical protein